MVSNESRPPNSTHILLFLSQRVFKTSELKDCTISQAGPLRTWLHSEVIFRKISVSSTPCSLTPPVKLEPVQFGAGLGKFPHDCNWD